MPDKTLTSAVLSSGLGDVAVEYSELVIDGLLKEGALRDIPFLSSLIGFYKTQENVRDYLFSKKVEGLLLNLPKFSAEEVSEFNQRINADQNFASKVAEHITLLLDRLDDNEKAPLLAKAFSTFITTNIDFVTFKRIGRAIDRCMLEDLLEVHNFDHANDAHHNITPDLVSCGLIELVSLPLIQGPGANPTHKITEFGELFVRVVL